MKKQRFGVAAEEKNQRRCAQDVGRASRSRPHRNPAQRLYHEPSPGCAEMSLITTPRRLAQRESDPPRLARDDEAVRKRHTSQGTRPQGPRCLRAYRRVEGSEEVAESACA